MYELDWNLGAFNSISDLVLLEGLATVATERLKRKKTLTLPQKTVVKLPKRTGTNYQIFQSEFYFPYCPWGWREELTHMRS